MVSSLGKGGVERSTALNSIMLSDLGYNVHIVTVLNHIEYDFKGTLLNLGDLRDKNGHVLSRRKRFKVFKKYLKTHNFDVIIDHRSKPNALKEFLIQKLVYKNRKIVNVVHSYKTEHYLPKQKWIYDLFFDTSITHVTVSNAIHTKLKNFYKLSNVVTIYNAVDIEYNAKQATENIDIDYKYILFYGRLIDKVKNISLLIEAYKQSKLKDNAIKLVILGNGEDLQMLKTKVNTLKLQNFIVFLPHTRNPFPYIKNAKFTVLTSRNEGFPMVLPEALSLSTPVVSVDCESGPNEIIQHKYNGLLVENHNAKILSEALNSFIFDNKLYATCKQNAVRSVQRFSMIQSAKQWKNLIESID
ncbi:glycosyltransferase [Lacinutrix salivirga]